VWELRWSPDRSRAAYIIYNTDQPDHNGQILSTDLFVFDVASGGTRLVAHEPAQVDGESLTWAPDDRTLAYRVQNDPIRTERGVTLKVADVLEGTPVAIAVGISPVAWRPIWR
jgi:Tol biopolymer transport system component